MKGEGFLRVLEKYGIKGLADEVVDKWTRDDESERSSTRDLAKLVNERICVEVMRDADGMPPITAIDDLVAVLQVALKQHRSEEPIETEWSDWVIEEVKAWFDQETEIGWEELAEDFVSYSLVYTYLTNIRGAKQQSQKNNIDTPGERRRSVIERVEKSTRYTESTTEWAIEHLQQHELLPSGDPWVNVSIEVECSECLQNISIYDYIEGGGCPQCGNSLECFSSDEESSNGEQSSN